MKAASLAYVTGCVWLGVGLWIVLALTPHPGVGVWATLGRAG